MSARPGANLCRLRVVTKSRELSSRTARVCLTPVWELILAEHECIVYMKQMIRSGSSGSGLTQKLLYAFFWVIPRRPNFICRRFGTHCSIFIGRWVWSTTRFEKCWGIYTGKGLARKWLEPNLFLCKYPNICQTYSCFIPTCLWRWNRQCVPKRRHIKFRRRGITQKKAYNIQNMAKVWNQEPRNYFPLPVLLLSEATYYNTSIA